MHTHPRPPRSGARPPRGGVPADTLRTARRAALLAAALLACAQVGGPANPFVPEARWVLAVSERDGFLDATLAGRPELRFLFPTTPVCRALLHPEGQVEYSARGRWGQLAPPDPESPPCVPLGVGSLERWRARQPRPGSPGLAATPLPRRTARFEQIHADDRGLFLRGRWPLASWIGFANAADLVALVPNTPACREAAAGGEATMEYRFTGTPVYSLMVRPPASCPIEAFAIPPDPRGAP